MNQPVRNGSAVRRRARALAHAVHTSVCTAVRCGRTVVANLIVILIIVAAALLIGLFMSVRIVKQYEDGVLFPLGRVGGARASPAA